ncbi:MAG: hypothetical protein SFV21_13285 [Rhodospirillaceae bacterium]|nr:hypothetical protein [Rhodospirillaceae bacterium]
MTSGAVPPSSNPTPSTFHELCAALAAAADWSAAGAPITAACQVLTRRVDTGAADSAVAELLHALDDTALRLFRAQPTGGRLTFSIAALALPPAFAMRGYHPRERDAWHHLHRALLDAARARPPSMAELLRLMMVEGIAAGPGPALAGLVTRVGDDGLTGRLQSIGMKPADLGATLAAMAWFETAAGGAGSDALAVAIDDVLTRAAAGGAVAYASLGLSLIKLLAFDRARPMAWLEFLCRALLLPQIRAAARDPALADHALIMERLIYTTILKKEENADIFARTYDAIGTALAAAGRAYGAALFGDRRAMRVPALPAGGPPRVAFFIMGDFSTGHAEALYMVLRGLSQLSPRPIAPLIYVLDGPGPNLNVLLASVAGLDVTVRWPDGRAGAATFGLTTADAQWLRTRVVDDGVAALAFVSVTLGMCFAAGMPVAPVQVWWSMKYHSLYVPELEGYLTNALFGHRPPGLGPHWRVGDTSMPFGCDPSLSAQAQKLRAEIDPGGQAVVLGCLVRAEKLANPAYAKMLGRVMRAHPHTLFVWTGRFAPPDVVALLEAEGIAPRCRFVGWVDIKLYAQVLDIKLDSFPFPSGITSAETMAAGKPVVTLLTEEALENSLATSFVPLMQGRIGTPEDHAAMRARFSDPDDTPAPFVETIDDYERLAGRLIADASMRARVGAACQWFVGRFFRDDARTARTTAEQILAIVADTRARGPAPTAR